MGKNRSRRSWMDRARRLEKAITDYLELPADAVLDLPRLTLVGNSRLVVENHRGISEYQPDLVRLKLSTGELEIKGTGMLLREIKPDAIALEGTIQSLTFC
ncbi:Sporulation protein YqfC [Moorella glycerini]|jgi:sporulation protein YqfC|uniref:YabP family protein n=1 Tax=Neomoorella stamsii TaxID=1266720 RepID=A0A9X7J5Z3_9FIRM|nr:MULTISPECIES: sporulation protein YqfC [Moorella]PRR77481.1 YabP family protein [Moorella stamsii]CEP68230.1 Sporulation protein YqfC [Moorella glycerini]